MTTALGELGARAKARTAPATKRSLRLQASMQLALRAWRMRYRAVNSPETGIPKPSVWERGALSE